MKKRTICLLLAIIMVLSIVLAGCSKTAETPARDDCMKLCKRHMRCRMCLSYRL